MGSGFKATDSRVNSFRRSKAFTKAFLTTIPYFRVMKKAVIEAESYAPVEDVFDVIEDFRGYGDYSEFVEDIRVVDDGDQPEWEIDFSWWIVNYTARSKVLAVEEDEYIEWKVTKDVDVQGRWEFHEEGEEHTRVELHLWYDPEGATKANPLRYFPTHRLMQLAKPVANRQMKKVLRKLAEELEDEPREVDYSIRVEKTDEGADEDHFLYMLSDG